MFIPLMTTSPLLFFPKIGCITPALLLFNIFIPVAKSPERSLIICSANSTSFLFFDVFATFCQYSNSASDSATIFSICSSVLPFFIDSCLLTASLYSLSLSSIKLTLGPPIFSVILAICCITLSLWL